VAPPAANDPKTKEPTDNNAEAADPGKLIRLSKADRVWVNTKQKYVIVEGEIVLDNGQLELFACPQGTKEHESVVAVDSRAFVVHTGLLAVGARSGHPVQFNPVYLIPTGDVIEVYVYWTDKEGKQHQIRAQELVRNMQTEKAMKHNWVFGGSGFWTDETTNEQRYLGESGELICVSNFPTATMDVQVKSSQGNDSLLFEAFTENIPPRKTKVHLLLMPQKQGEAKREPLKELPTIPAEPAAEKPKQEKSNEK
jgi:hypothetical protein